MVDEELYQAKPYSFDLHEDMVRLLHEEFNMQKLVERFAHAIAGKDKKEIDRIGKEIFKRYGRDWMKRTHQLGDEYPDRTYEVLLAAADRTGGYLFFPHVPQRFIEIAYLSTMHIRSLPIVEHSAHQLTYKMVDCWVFKTLAEKCGQDIAKLMLCQNACLAAAETLLQDLNIDGIVNMKASMVKDGYCQFTLRKI